MTEEKSNKLRTRLAPMLPEYLKASRIPYYPTELTNCPRCGNFAIIKTNNIWECKSCRISGDVVDYELMRGMHKDEQSAMKYVCRLLKVKITELEAISAGELMDMEFEHSGYLVENLLGKGVFILAGPSKIGKSWLVLYFADRISQGKPIWELQTAQTGALYISLEDTSQRLQRRLNDVTGGMTGDVYLATEAELIGSGFEEQLSNFLTEHHETGFVIIDTLQRIRQIKGEKYSYAGDYETVTTLKNIADKFNVTILLVHHTRKEADEDPFNMISGTTGLLGCADGALVLQKASRLSSEATLDVTGRDLIDLRLNLHFNKNTKMWEFMGYAVDTGNPQDDILSAVQQFVEETHEWQGTSTQLLELLQARAAIEAKPNTLVRKLNASSAVLELDYGVKYSTSRDSTAKRIHLEAVK